MIHTQAEISRAVKAAIRPARDLGLIVTGYKVTFCQGVPTVEVTTVSDSPAPAPTLVGGVNVETLTQQLRARHATRRS
jgi:hypothetical protein